MKSNDFAHPPPDAIAADGPAKRFLDAPAEPAKRQAVGAQKNGEFAARLLTPFAIHRVEIGATDQAAGAWEIEPLRAPTRFRHA